jgi:uncharacterized protein (DUF433 family)
MKPLPSMSPRMLTVRKSGGDSSEFEESLIKKTPGVVGGDACIRSTRIPVWTLVRLRQLGMKDAELRTHFVEPLTQSDLDAAWEYASAHSRETEQAIQENEAD